MYFYTDSSVRGGNAKKKSGGGTKSGEVTGELPTEA
jgi:hypothetical protein